MSALPRTRNTARQAELLALLPFIGASRASDYLRRTVYRAKSSKWRSHFDTAVRNGASLNGRTFYKVAPEEANGDSALFYYCNEVARREHYVRVSWFTPADGSYGSEPFIMAVCDNGDIADHCPSYDYLRCWCWHCEHAARLTERALWSVYWEANRYPRSVFATATNAAVLTTAAANTLATLPPTALLVPDAAVMAMRRAADFDF